MTRRKAEPPPSLPHFEEQKWGRGVAPRYILKYKNGGGIIYWTLDRIGCSGKIFVIETR
jgi:hypothetical protein